MSFPRTLRACRQGAGGPGPFQARRNDGGFRGQSWLRCFRRDRGRHPSPLSLPARVCAPPPANTESDPPRATAPWPSVRPPLDPWASLSLCSAGAPFPPGLGLAHPHSPPPGSPPSHLLQEVLLPPPTPGRQPSSSGRVTNIPRVPSVAGRAPTPLPLPFLPSPVARCAVRHSGRLEGSMTYTWRKPGCIHSSGPRW